MNQLSPTIVGSRPRIPRASSESEVQLVGATATPAAHSSEQCWSIWAGPGRPSLAFPPPAAAAGRSNYGRIVAHLFADWGPPRTPLVRALRCGERRRDHSCERLFPPFARSFGAAEGNRILAVVIEGKRRTSTSGQSRERKRVKTDRSHCVFLALCPLRDSLSVEDGTMRCRVRPAHRRRRAARGHAEGGRARRGSAVGRARWH